MWETNPYDSVVGFIFTFITFLSRLEPEETAYLIIYMESNASKTMDCGYLMWHGEIALLLWN